MAMSLKKALCCASFPGGIGQWCVGLRAHDRMKDSLHCLWSLFLLADCFIRSLFKTYMLVWCISLVSVGLVSKLGRQGLWPWLRLGSLIYLQVYGTLSPTFYILLTQLFVNTNNFMEFILEMVTPIQACKENVFKLKTCCTDSWRTLNTGGLSPFTPDCK